MLLAVLVIAACDDDGAMATSAPSSEPALVVTRGTFTSEILLTGELMAADSAPVVIPNVNVWPMQIRWLAEDGVEVQEGDLVVELDSSQLDTNIEELRVAVIEAENGLLSARARIAAEVVEAEFAVTEAEARLAKARLQASVPRGLYSEQAYHRRLLDLDQAELELGEARSNLDSVQGSGQIELRIEEIGLRKAREAVATAERELRTMSLYAPRSGVLVINGKPREQRPFQPGDEVYPGYLAATIPDLGSMIVKAELSDVDDGRVTHGQQVSATLDAFPDLVFTGRVSKIDSHATANTSWSRRRFFRVTVELDLVDTERMRPGMSVKVVVHEQPLSDVLLVPRAALTWRQQKAELILANHARVPVTVGSCNPQVCVVEDGVAEGTRLTRSDT
jgi:multidrug efflux pump subunit AcrA (membrane-fusion protein)